MSPSAYFAKKDRLGALLIAAGRLQPHQLERALAHQGSVPQRIGEILLSLGLIGDDDLANALVAQLDLPLYAGQEEDTFLPLDISPPFQRAHPFVLVGREGVAQPLLVVSDPFDQDLLLAADLICDPPPLLHLAPEPLLKKLVQAHYNLAFHEAGEEGVAIDEEDIDKLKDMASEAPVIKYVNTLIDTAVGRRASDIHMEPFEDGMKIRLRIDGTLYDFEIPPHAMQPAIVSRTKLLAGLDIAERRLPQDGKISMRIAGREIDLRVSTLPTIYGEGVVIRILEKGSIILDLERLGMAPETEARFRQLIAVPDGIFLVTGPTGSGKTTTLYCALNQINTGEKKIITVEDPVEYQLHGINQIQVRPEIGLTFARGLRSIVRQDPDVIMIGEIRDLDTAEIAVQSSLTGHLVFSTLHTNDAVSAVVRLLDLGVERFLISASLRGVLAQRLVRRICPHCKTEAGTIGSLGVQINGGDFPVYEGKGCPACGHTGYSGRIGIYELLVIDEAMNRGISQGLDLDELRRLAEERGFTTMFADGLAKVRRGETTFAEVVRVCRGAEYGAL
ncbi:MAG: ATPase, T2SS/T4P/T4SS family [Thermodesulfobacteriota bacterium]